jgi:hypothetical protein
MRRLLLLVAGTLLAAGPAAAQQADPPAPDKPMTMPTEAMKADEATKHVALIEVGLDTAELNADMLGELSKKESTFDEAHRKALVDNIEAGLADANEHLKHLEPLAGNSQHFLTLKQRVESANRMLPELQKATDVKQATQQAQRMEDALDQADKPLEQVARDLRVTLDVG